MQKGFNSTTETFNEYTTQNGAKLKTSKLTNDVINMTVSNFLSVLKNVEEIEQAFCQEFLDKFLLPAREKALKEKFSTNVEYIESMPKGMFGSWVIPDLVPYVRCHDSRTNDHYSYQSFSLFTSKRLKGQLDIPMPHSLIHWLPDEIHEMRDISSVVKNKREEYRDAVINKGGEFGEFYGRVVDHFKSIKEIKLALNTEALAMKHVRDWAKVRPEIEKYLPEEAYQKEKVQVPQVSASAVDALIINSNFGE